MFFSTLGSARAPSTSPGYAYVYEIFWAKQTLFQQKNADFQSILAASASTVTNSITLIGSTLRAFQ